MEKTTYRQYQKIIRREAWQKFSKRHGIQDIIIAVLVGAVVGFMDRFYLKGNETLLVALATFGIFFIVYSVFYLGYFAREHLEIYTIQNNTIENLEKRLQTEVFDIKIEDAKMYNMHGRDEEVNYSIMLPVTNLDKKNKIIDLEAKIVYIDQTYVFDGSPTTLPFNDSIPLVWQDGETKSELIPEASFGLEIASLDSKLPNKIRFGKVGYYASGLFDMEFGLYFPSKNPGQIREGRRV